MQDADREYLKKAFQSLAQPAVVPIYDDPHFAQTDPVQDIARVIEYSGSRSTLQLLTGARGVGKTTALHRLGRILPQGGFQLSYKELNATVDPTLPLNDRTFIAALQPSTSNPGRTVMLVDSMEHRFAGDLNAETPLIDFFIRYAKTLRLLGYHMVITVPLALSLRDKRWGSLYDGGGIHVLWPVQVQDPTGHPIPAGIAALAQLVDGRLPGGWRRLFREERHLHQLILASGGLPGTLIRLLKEVILAAKSVPIGADEVEIACQRLRDQLLPIADGDVPMLAQAASSHDVALTRPADTDRLTRLMDSLLVLSYRNGREWFTVNPLVRDEVLLLAGQRAAAAPAAAAPSTFTPTAPLPAEMAISVSADNYRALRRVEWRIPRGLSVLVGPNGSGKTTLLDIPQFLRHTLQLDVRKALDSRGGPRDLRHFDAAPDVLVHVGIAVDDLSWQLALSPKGAGQSPLYEEQLRHGDNLETVSQEPVALRARGLRPPFLALVQMLSGCRLYQSYDLERLRRTGSIASSDDFLQPSGDNLYAVLRNWRDRAESRPRFDFVLDALRDAFPDSFADLDFEVAGQTVSGRIQTPQTDRRIAAYSAAQGWLVALLHLCAVASVEPGGLVAIDEPENGLHPFAIRQLLQAMDAWAAQQGCSILLATHSPVVLDEIAKDPDRVFVMEPGHDVLPVPLSQLRSPEWLSNFSVGKLYANLEFGAPQR